MANMSLNVNMENLTEEERNQLLALVKKSTEEKPKVWKPKDDEEYYYILPNGNVSHESKFYKPLYANHYKNYLSNKEGRYSIGNCYRTEKEALFALEKQKVIAELKRFAQEHNEKIDWNNEDQRKYHLYYTCSSNSIDIGFMYFRKFGSIIYFSSEKIAQQAIKTIGANRLKKYYFEVEE